MYSNKFIHENFKGMKWNNAFIANQNLDIKFVRNRISKVNSLTIFIEFNQENYCCNSHKVISKRSTPVSDYALLYYFHNVKK